jgi:hypothetical protein
MYDVPDLTAIANLFGSDKGDKIFHAHGYTLLYSFLFEQFRTEYFNFLEIGLHRGEIDPERLLTRTLTDVPSIKMWLEFFPKAEAYGFDISDFSGAREERFTFIRGDMGSEADMKKLKITLPRLRIIVEDGSHAQYHQQFAFKHLFQKIESGGFYVIEDLHSGHPVEARLPPTPRTSAVFETFMKTGYLGLECANDYECAALSRQIKNVYMHRSAKGGVDRWSPKMIAIQKV